MHRDTGYTVTQDMVSAVTFRFWLAFLLCLLSTPYLQAAKGPHEWASIRLDYACQGKVRQLRRFCNGVHNLAMRAQKDEILRDFFEVNLKYTTLVRQQQVPPELEKKVKVFREQINDYYVRNYLSFCDLLFINNEGHIFYTIRKEADYKQDLFSTPFSKTPLAEGLKSASESEVFIDFHQYAASKKPAAFFVEPIKNANGKQGWIALQCAPNKINSLFAGTEQLGQTGEIFLVNRNGYLLTESSFLGENTILKTHLNQSNISDKFLLKHGRKTVTDYRGQTALTAFQVFDFLDTQWLVVAKVDEAQRITEHFKEHHRYYSEKIAHYLSQTPPTTRPHKEPTLKKGKLIQVDMDEFVRANHGEMLKTIGVSTCTAVIATYPKKFGYLAHISPYDKVYGGNATNLLGHIIKKIKAYDIYKYERQQVRFIVVANHLESLENIATKLVDEGFLLSQVHVMHHPNANCANVTYDYSADRVCVKWFQDKSPVPVVFQELTNSHNLGEIIKKYVED